MTDRGQKTDPPREPGTTPGRVRAASEPPRSGGSLSNLRSLLLHPASVPPPPAVPAPPPEVEVPIPEPRAVTTGASVPTDLDEELWGGRFRVTEELGRGAMSVVILASDTKLRRDLALKVSPKPRDELAIGELARFVEEAQITAQLEHPNVVPVHDIGLDPEGRAYFSMKLVRGQSLEDIFDKLVDRDPETTAEFGLRRLLDVFLQACQAVDYAHSRGVIHRDLKPSNIMVGDFGEVLVMDWGVAKLMARAESIPPPAASRTEDRAAVSSRPSLIPPADVTSVRAGRRGLATHAGAVIGTPAYMSPEQASGDAVDARADIYALGVILYQILCGEVPFDHDDPEVILELLRNELPMPPSEINPKAPRALESLALQMLEKDPARRALTLRQIRSYVQDYIEGVGRDFRRESPITHVLRIVFAVGFFAFLVWYSTGKSVGSVLAMAPASVFSAVGWLLLLIAIRYPLWAESAAFLHSRPEHDRFRKADEAEIFVAGYSARRTSAAALAPLFGLTFVVELVAIAAARTGDSAGSVSLMEQIIERLRTGWANALIGILVCLFAYVVFLSAELRVARRLERYAPFIERPAWESVWPGVLIIVLLLTTTTTGLLDWMLARQSFHPVASFLERVSSEPLNAFDVVKTFVFQGTFLLGLVAAVLLNVFPFAEALAALRLSYQAADQASVASRPEYFLRSLSFFRMARASFLYAGAVIGCLTAIAVLFREGHRPLLEHILYISGPPFIGFAGFRLTRSYALRYLSETPAVQRLLDSEAAEARQKEERVRPTYQRPAPLRLRVAELAVPVVCVFGYLVWTGSSVSERSLRELVLPVSTTGWLVIAPYVLLVAALLLRDGVESSLRAKR